RGLLFAEIHDAFGDVGPFHGNGVLDAIPQQVQDIRPPLDDDDAVGLEDIRAGRCPLFADGPDLLYPEGLADIVQQLVAVYGPVVEPVDQDLLGPLDDLLPFADPDVLDRVHGHVGYAGTDTVDRLERCGKDSRLCPVERGGDQDLSLCLSLLARDLDVDSAHTPCPLEIPQVEVFAE